MKTTYKKLPNSQAKVNVAIPNNKVQVHVDLAITRLGATVEIKGFRKGHAPKNLVVDKVGLGRISQEALDMAMQEGYIAAITEHKFHPISQPAVSLKKFNLMPNGKVEGDLEYELTIDLMPDITLGDYTKIKADPKIVNEKIEVKKEEVDKVFEHLRKQKSNMEETKKPVSKGDWVEISFAGTLNKVALEKLASKNHPLIVGSGAMVPGFEEAIIGMEIDKPKKVDITFPKDYFAKDLAGKKVEFTITVHKIKKIILPEIDKKFALEFGHNDINALTKAIEDQLNYEKKMQHQQKIESNVLEQARKLLKVTIPEGLLHSEVDRMIDKQQESIEKQGVGFDQYLESIKKTREDLHKDLRPQAQANIEIGFLIGEVVNREKLDTKDPDVSRIALAKMVDYATKK